MTAVPPPKGLTLAIHPTHRGFGWVAFEGPFAPYDWGMVFTRRRKNAHCLRRTEALLGRFLPDTLVLEVFNTRTTTRTHRISRLCRAMVSLAIDRGVEVAIYSRGDVRACFANVGAGTRQEIAEAVARHIDAFRHQLPRKRRSWESEDRRMAIFAAAALVLTHYQLGASRFLDGLGETN
jgi:Holliday junction resolvasome RuvABC endonuclease subunit